MTAQVTIERSGLPGNPPPPPPPPKRERPRRSSSSKETTLPGALREERRPGPAGPPQGPPLCPSPEDGSSDSASPPLGPHGPLLSANRPRRRLPHPRIMLMPASIGSARDEKQWQAVRQHLCR